MLLLYVFLVAGTIEAVLLLEQVTRHCKALFAQSSDLTVHGVLDISTSRDSNYLLLLRSTFQLQGLLVKAVMVS